MTTNIDNIYSDFRTNYVDTPDFVIDFYSKNAIYFNNISHFKDKSELRLYIELTWQYLNAVYKKDRFNLTVDTANKTLLLIDNEIDRLNATDLKDDTYNGLLSFKAMASYNLRDYKTSATIFKTLTQLDNNNERFKNWLTFSVYGQRLWLTKTINVVCGGLIVTETIFASHIPNYYIRQTMLVVGVLGLLTNWGYEYYIKRNLRKTKTN